MKSCCFWPFKFCFAETPPRDFAASQQTMFGLIERYFPVNFSKFLRTPFYRALLAAASDSLNVYFRCQWKQRALILFAFLKKFLFNTFLIVCRFDFSPNSKSHVDQIDETQAKIVTLSKRIKFLLWRHFQGDKFNLKLQVICTSFVEGRGKVSKIGQNKSFLRKFLEQCSLEERHKCKNSSIVTIPTHMFLLNWEHLLYMRTTYVEVRT